MQDPNLANSTSAVPSLTLGGLLRVLRRFYPYLRPHKIYLALLFLILPLSVSVLVALPAFATKLVIDLAFPRKDSALLILLGFVVVISMFLERFLGVYIRNLVCSILRVRIQMSLGEVFYRHMLARDMRFQQSMTVGEKIFRTDTDTYDTVEMLGTFLPFTVQYIFQFTIMVITVSLIDWRPLALALGVSPIFYIISHYLYNYYRRVDLTHRETGQRLTSRIEQSLSAIPTVYAHGTRLTERVRYYRTLVPYSIANFFAIFMNEIAIVLVWPSGLPAISAGFLMGLCGYLVVTQELTLGQWQAMNTLIIQAIVPLGILISYYQQIRLRMIAAQRVLAMLETTAEDTAAASGSREHSVRGEIELRNVHFAYAPDRPVLRGVDLRIPAGSRVAIVGPSGMGKTTILNLLLRFYEPDQGQVLVDGIDTRELNPQHYRRQLGIVLQEPVVFDTTIRENIAYSNRHLSDDQLNAAIALVGLEPSIERLPLGVETVLHDHAGLSLGEKQRIMLARCMAGEPAVVLLDEPTAQLDPASKYTVVDAIDRATHGRTTIFVSHDLLTLHNLDQIFVLREGRIAEAGTHAELMARRGHYHAMWELQHQQHAGAEALAS